jgi:hypothetical protein
MGPEAFFYSADGENTIMFTANNSGGRRRREKSLKQTLFRYWDPGIFLIAAGLISAFILVVLSLMFPAESGAAAHVASDDGLRPSGVREGSLLLENGGSGQYTAAPLLNTEVKIEVPHISPPAVEPGQENGNPVSLQVILDPGFNLSRLQSLNHAVDVVPDGANNMLISLTNSRVVGDRDFVLEWEPAADSLPRTATVSELCFVLGGLALLLAAIVWFLGMREKTRKWKSGKC